MDGVDANLRMVGTVASSTRNHRIPEPPELQGAVAPRKVERQISQQWAVKHSRARIHRQLFLGNSFISGN